jgi:hypothetical protein
MKTILQLPLMVALYCACSITLLKSQEVFNVSKAGSDKSELNSAFAAIQKIEKDKKYGEPTTFEILQKLDSKGYLVYKTRTEYNTVSSGMSSIGGGGGGYTTSSEVTDRSKIYYLVIREVGNHADGDRLEGMFTVDAAKTKTYTNTLGAAQTVTVLEEVVPVELSQEDFVARLKKGESWVLKNFRKKSCGGCFGDGKLNAMKNYARCPDCKGEGYAMLDCVVKW